MKLKSLLLTNLSLAKKILETIPYKIPVLLGEKKAYRLFKKLQKNSAYRSLLQHINPINSKNSIAFSNAPIIDKESYIKKFKLESISKYPIVENYTIEKSSGHSGTPYFWPRFRGQDDGFPRYMRLGLEKMFNIQKKSTLFINTFALGTWVTGVKLAKFTLQIANLKSYKFTAVNTGTSMPDILSIIENFENFFDQIIIAGYPPFVTNVLEEALSSKVIKSKNKYNFILGGESFPEAVRDYYADLLSFDVEKFEQKVLSAFGSADTGLEIGYEHPITILLRRALIKNGETARELLGNQSNYVPHFFQYNPMDIWIEAINEELIFTCDGGIPIVRYNLHDKGGILNYPQILNILKRIRKDNSYLAKLKPFHLPAVYVHGRSDGSISLDGENIYIQDIQQAISSTEEINNLIKTDLKNESVVINLIPHRKVAQKLLENQANLVSIPLEAGIISNFKVSALDNKLDLFLEIDERVNLDQYIIDNLEKIFYKVFTILFYRKVPGYKTLVAENLNSADITIHVCPFNTGVFKDSFLQIKNKYKIN